MLLAGTEGALDQGCGLAKAGGSLQFYWRTREKALILIQDLWP